jgi:hypothetical protein
MAGKKRRKRRAHRVRGSAAARSKARQHQASAGPARSSPDRQGIAPRVPSGNGVETTRLSRPRSERAEIAATPGWILLPTTPQFGRFRRVLTVLVPGQAFFAIGRPGPGLVCCVLQASLLGWVPAALWAVRAERRVAEKQRSLAARLRPL